MSEVANMFPGPETLCNGRGWIPNPENGSGWFACRGCSACGMPRVQMAAPPVLHSVKVSVEHENGEQRPLGVPPSSAPPPKPPAPSAAAVAAVASPKRRGRSKQPPAEKPPVEVPASWLPPGGAYRAPDALEGQLPIPGTAEVPESACGCGATALEAVDPHKLDEVEAAGGYKVVYADPPWDYVQGGRGASENHYESMSIEEIKALPIGRLASKDAVLFLWGVWPHLPEVLATMVAWGFTYKTCGFVWVKHREKSGKEHVGGGFWSRANTEFCLIGVRGKDYPKRLDDKPARSVRQLVQEWPEEEEVLSAPLGEHSSKPAEVRERIRTMLGDLPAIELFARERVEGWDCWGRQAPGGSDVIFP